MQNIVTGVDIGGTHITAALVDLDNRSIIRESIQRSHLDTAASKQEVIHAWCSCIKAAIRSGGVEHTKIGIAMPGPCDYELGTILIQGLGKYENLYGENLKHLVGEELRIEPGDVLMINDASAFLLGEMHGGAARGVGNVVGITLGTGLGSASYHDERLHEGDLWCTPFRSSRAEDHACARAIIERYHVLSGKRVHGVREIAENAETLPEASLVLAEFGNTLGEILAGRYGSQQPAVIVIGGSIAGAWNHFIVQLERSAFDHGLFTDFRRSSLGEEASLIGGAFLWKDKL